MKSIKETHVTLTTRGLLPAVLAAFALFLAYRFLAEVATTALLIAAGLLAAVALSAPVEALHRRKVPRPASVALIVVGGGRRAPRPGRHLLLPVLADQATDLVFALPAALSQLVERAREFARGLGISIGGGEGISTSTLVSWGRRLLGGAIGVLTGGGLRRPLVVTGQEGMPLPGPGPGAQASRARGRCPRDPQHLQPARLLPGRALWC